MNKKGGYRGNTVPDTMGFVGTNKFFFSLGLCNEIDIEVHGLAPTIIYEAHLSTINVT